MPRDSGYKEGVMLISINDVISKAHLSKTTIYEQIKSGDFVPSIQVGERACRFLSHEVETILAARIAGKSSEEIKLLVRTLKDSRKNLLTSLTNQYLLKAA